MPDPLPTPDSAPKLDPVTPAAPPAPTLPMPSASVQPFVSGGGPPPGMSSHSRPKRSFMGLLMTLLVLGTIAAVAAAGWYVYTQTPFAPKPSPQAKAAPTPTPLDSLSLEASVTALDASLGDVDTSLAGAEAGLADKAGDLSE